MRGRPPRGRQKARGEWDSGVGGWGEAESGGGGGGGRVGFCFTAAAGPVGSDLPAVAFPYERANVRAAAKSYPSPPRSRWRRS
eukprot:9461366-Pyramimonas_sp.AAC.1